MIAKKIKLMVITCFTAISCSSVSTNADSKVLLAKLKAKNGSNIEGNVIFRQVDSNNVRIEFDLYGFKPGSSHGVHIHHKGNCYGLEAQYTGSHFSPNNKGHGGLYDQKSHAGDLGNIVANQAGVIKTSLVTDKISTQEDSKFSVVKRSIVIHQEKDDLETDPKGGSGKKIACGVIYESTKNKVSSNY